MNDRGMKKWRPFNAVVPSSELLRKEENIPLPTLSKDEKEEFEEILKDSMYTHSKVKIFFIENNKEIIIDDVVIGLDPIKKDIILKERKINFRQIHKVIR